MAEPSGSTHAAVDSRVIGVAEGGLRAAARPLTGAADDYDALAALVGNCHYVLLGEATHGSEEFRRERHRITRRLIEEHGFSEAGRLRLPPLGELPISRESVDAWNDHQLRMAERLDALARELVQRRVEPKIVVWGHNALVGDARATELSGRGAISFGQLVREKHKGETLSVGFTTYEGVVTSTSGEDAPAESKTLRPALAGSYEALLHEVGLPAFVLLLRGNLPASNTLAGPLLQRVIGAVYRQDDEQTRQYIQADLRAQFDAIVHIDRTTAMPPLVAEGRPPRDDAPETYPTGT